MFPYCFFTGSRLVGAFDVGQQGVEFPDARGIDLRRFRHAMDEGRATLRQHVEALVPRPGLGPELHLLVTSGLGSGKWPKWRFDEIWVITKT